MAWVMNVDMSNVIIIQGDSRENFYAQTIDYLESKYHYSPSYSPDLCMDERAIAEMGYYERMAYEVSENESQTSNVPLGKLVI